MTSDSENTNASLQSPTEAQQPTQETARPHDEDAHVVAVLPPAKPLITFGLIAASVLVFAAMVATGTSAMEPTVADRVLSLQSQCRVEGER